MRNPSLWLPLYAVLALLPWAQAQAEGTLIRSEPARDAAVSEYDGTVRLWFSGNVSQRAPSLVVVDQAGNRLDHGDAKLTIGQRSELSATTGPLAAGSYVVRYRVLTQDGLVVSGIYRFTVKT